MSYKEILRSRDTKILLLYSVIVLAVSLAFWQCWITTTVFTAVFAAAGVALNRFFGDTSEVAEREEMLVDVFEDVNQYVAQMDLDGRVFCEMDVASNRANLRVFVFKSNRNEQEEIFMKIRERLKSNGREFAFTSIQVISVSDLAKIDSVREHARDSLLETE